MKPTLYWRRYVKHKAKTWAGETDFKYAHYKRDGIWLEVTQGHAYSSQLTVLTHQVEHLEWFQNLKTNAPASASVYGELWVPGQPASYVKSALAKGEQLSFDMFAASNLNHAAPLEEVGRFATYLKVNLCPFLTLDSTRGSIVELQAGELPEDTEGYVFKNGNLLDWCKWKRELTIDCVVTGFVDGRGKNLGLTGAILCSVYHKGQLVEIANAGGFTDRERIHISADEESYLGRVAEITYQYVGSNGRLRHPRFKRWREDKMPHECTSDQDGDLYDRS
jgi:hypothetical protein